MDYQKYKEAKQYIDQFEKHKESVRKQRVLIKKGNILDYGSFMLKSLQHLKEEFSRDLFYYNHNTDTKWLEEHIISSRKRIFDLTKRIRLYKKTNPELFKTIRNLKS